MRLRIFSTFMVITIVVTILYLTPGSEMPQLNQWNFFSVDKWLHFICFSAIGLSLVTALRKQRKYVAAHKNASYIVFFGITVYGILLETLQGILYTDRYSELSDIVANIIGVFIGIVIYKLIYGKELTSN